LKSNTKQVNRTIIATNFIHLHSSYKRKKAFFDSDEKEFFIQKNTSEDKTFSINSIDDKDIVYDNFIDDRLTSTSSSNFPKMQYFKNLKDFSNMENPKLPFINTFLRSIAVIIQPTLKVNKRENYE
jgi:hypothetical protein